jgi:hypothetical protein
MKDLRDGMNVSVNRRSFVKSGLTAATVGAGLLYPSASVLAHGGSEERSGHLDQGDSSILRFLAAAEILETDLWQQYNELGGIPDSEVPGGSGNPTYTAALAVLDADMAQYISHTILCPFICLAFLGSGNTLLGHFHLALDDGLPASRSQQPSGRGIIHACVLPQQA